MRIYTFLSIYCKTLFRFPISFVCQSCREKYVRITYYTHMLIPCRKKGRKSKDFSQRSLDVISQSYSHARSFTMVLWRYTWYLSNNNVRSHVDRNSVAIWNCVWKKLKVMWYKQIWSKMKQRAREFLFLLIIILLFRYHFSLLFFFGSHDAWTRANKRREINFVQSYKWMQKKRKQETNKTNK